MGGFLSKAAMKPGSGKSSLGGGSQGFTLVELMIALAILSIGIIGIIRLFDHAAYSSKFSKNLNTANRITQTTMEKLSTLGYENVLNSMPAGNYTESGATKASWENQSTGGVTFKVTVQIVEDHVITGPVEVDYAVVTVSWNHRGLERKVRYETYL